MQQHYKEVENLTAELAKQELQKKAQDALFHEPIENVSHELTKIAWEYSLRKQERLI